MTPVLGQCLPADESWREQRGRGKKITGENFGEVEQSFVTYHPQEPLQLSAKPPASSAKSDCHPGLFCRRRLEARLDVSRPVQERR